MIPITRRVEGCRLGRLLGVLNLNISQVVVLEEVIVIGVLDTAISVTAAICTRCIIVSLVSLMIKLFHYVLLLQAIV